MRQRLKKKQEALADFFDFKIYVAFIFKDQKKGSALFEAAEVIPIMTNNYEDKIMKVRDRYYGAAVGVWVKDTVASSWHIIL